MLYMCCATWHAALSTYQTCPARFALDLPLIPFVKLVQSNKFCVPAAQHDRLMQSPEHARVLEERGTFMRMQTIDCNQMVGFVS